jgi:hypothetical protein
MDFCAFPSGKNKKAYQNMKNKFFLPVLQIRDILVRIRILPFLSLTFKTPTKNYFCLSFYAYYLQIHYFSKVKSHKEVKKQ